MLKVTSWNVNSIKSRISHIENFIENNSPDILLLQELKCEDKAFPLEHLDRFGYEIITNGQKTYNGVAILSKYRIEEVSKSFDNDPDPQQARYIEAVVSVNSRVIRCGSIYVPNGSEIGADKYVYKLEFLDAYIKYIEKLRKWDEKLVIGGDFNIAPCDIDVFNPKLLENAICFSKAEKDRYFEILSHGLTDNFRALHPALTEYTWWDYRAGGWQNNKGLRIDHIITSSQLTNCLKKVIIHKEERSREKPSDHAPITAFYEL